MSNVGKEEYTQLQERLKKAEKKAFIAEEELKYLKASRLIGPVIKTRDWLRATQKNVVLPHKKIEYFLAEHLSTRTKNTLKYLIRREWLIKNIQCDMEKWPKNKPLVSVITPTWNRGESALKTIDSILNQTFQNFEYIIVDDGSEEVHKKVIKSIKNSRIQALFLPPHKESHPPAMARNVGISKARGKYIVCIDDDDWLEPTYLEKAVWVLESNPNVAIVSSYQKMFGARDDVYHYAPYNPKHLLNSNMVMHSAMYRKEAWTTAGGYKENIGYEDWEFWINLAENGYWGKLIPESLFNYQVSTQNSRYIEDLDSHGKNMQTIRALHPNYKNNLKKLLAKRRFKRLYHDPAQVSVNLSTELGYSQPLAHRQNILFVIPWMTFGGAETLIHNYTKEIRENFNISFVTTLKGDNEWEYKFREVTNSIYHLPNMFEDRELYIEFIINYIRTRKIDILHGIHIGYDYNLFQYLPRIKKEFPNLKIALTFFNDTVPLFGMAVDSEANVDKYIADNQNVVNRYLEKIPASKTRVIPNGVDSTDRFNPASYDRDKIRMELGILKNEVAVFFVGRISEEKKPDVFLEVAKNFSKDKVNSNIKFFMIGDGPMRTHIEPDFDKIPNFTYLGYQSEIAKYLSAADVFVLPSRIEGFPLSILEAMSMEVAIIASRVGAVPDILIDGQDGFVVTPCSTTEICESIAKLNGDRNLLDKMKKKGRIEVEEKYSNLVLGKNYVNLYNEELK